MEQPGLTPLWEHTPDWLVQMDGWIGRELQRLGRQMTAPPIPMRRLAWSTVLQIPSDAGPVFFKAVAPPLVYEVRVTRALAARRPDMVLAPLAVDEARGWMLLPDGGDRLREAVRSQRDPAGVHELLSHYAAFQQDAAQHVPELLALGAPDRRLARLAELYDQILEDAPMLRVGQENGLQPGELERLHALKPRLAGLCEQLAAYPVPESIHHGDLNDANVFYYPERKPGERFRLIDWGDSSVSHPFFSMRTALVSLEMSMDWEDEDPRDAAFVETYLQVYAGQAGLDMEDLRAAYQLSRPLAALVGALGWRHGMTGVPEALRMDYVHAVPSLLQEFMVLAG